MPPEHMMWPWPGMWIFPIIMFIMVLVVVLLVFGRGGCRPPWWSHGKSYWEGRDSETALEILKKRYAKGEITKEEFEQIKNDILD